MHVVDDDESIRLALSELLASVGLKSNAYASGDEFLESYVPNQPGCALVDERMPGVSGIALLEILRERGVLLPVIVITGFFDVEMAVDAMRRGAFDFLCKPFREQQLLDDVYCAIQEDALHRKDYKQRVAFERLLSRLTARERDVLDLVLAGEITRRIAEKLGISKRTVEVHRVHLMKKLRVGSIAELATSMTRFGRSNAKHKGKSSSQKPKH